MSRFSLYFGTGLLSVGLWQFLTLITRSVYGYGWLYWSAFFIVIVGSIVVCTAVARQVYSGQFATNNPTFLTVSIVALIGCLMGVMFGWGF